MARAETKKTEEREDARKEAEAEQAGRDLQAEREATLAEGARLREIETKLVEQERMSKEFSRLQAFESEIRKSQLSEKREIEERAKVDRERAEETLRQQRVGDLKAAQDERAAQEETARDKKELLEKMKVANEAILRVEGEMRQSRGTQMRNEEVVRGPVGTNLASAEDAAHGEPRKRADPNHEEGPQNLHGSRGNPLEGFKP